MTKLEGIARSHASEMQVMDEDLSNAMNGAMTIIDRSEDRWDERYQTHMAAMTGSIDLIRSSMLDLDKLNSARKLEIAQLRAGLWGVYSDHTETKVYDQKSDDQEAVLAAQVPQERFLNGRRPRVEPGESEQVPPVMRAVSQTQKREQKHIAMLEGAHEIVKVVLRNAAPGSQALMQAQKIDKTMRVALDSDGDGLGLPNDHKRDNIDHNKPVIR